MLQLKKDALVRGSVFVISTRNVFFFFFFSDEFRRVFSKNHIKFDDKKSTTLFDFDWHFFDAQAVASDLSNLGRSHGGRNSRPAGCFCRAAVWTLNFPQLNQLVDFFLGLWTCQRKWKNERKNMNKRCNKDEQTTTWLPIGGAVCWQRIWLGRRGWGCVYNWSPTVGCSVEASDVTFLNWLNFCWIPILAHSP